MKIIINAGHTIKGVGTGAQGQGYREEVITREIVSEMKPLLESKGHTVYIVNCDQASTVTAGLKYITDKENQIRPDVFVSVHFNAVDSSSAHGTEVYTLSREGKAVPYANRILNKLISMGLYNRGLKHSNFYVLRNTISPAVLVECAFITNKNDMSKYNAKTYALKIAEGILGQTISIAPPKPPAGTGFYRVVSGSFKDKANANERVSELKAKGFDSFLQYHNSMYRVICGSFQDKANALEKQTELKAKGFDSFLEYFVK